MAVGLNIAFAGTPELAARILEHIATSSRHSISAVFTQPDRPSGRGKKIKKSPVKVTAEHLGIQVYQPQNKVELESATLLKSVDVLVVAAYGLILTDSVLSLPKFGCINVHMSLLPRWRGAAPIQHAILAGDKTTGITIMQMDKGLDTGDILFQRPYAIEKNETAGSLHEKLSQLGSESITTLLDNLAEGTYHPVPQENGLATYAPKISKADALIDWQKSANEIERLIRAMNPVPIAHTVLDGQPVRIWEVEILKGYASHSPPGSIVDYSAKGLEVACKDNVINITKLQLPGKKPLMTSVFYNGNPSIWSCIKT